MCMYIPHGVAVMAFSVVVGLGLDYDVFLLSRVVRVHHMYATAHNCIDNLC